MGLKPVKYSTHAQLPPFVCCTYAVRLIVPPPPSPSLSLPKNNSFDARQCLTVALHRSPPPLPPPVNSSFAVTSASRLGEPKCMPKTGITPETISPPGRGGGRNHLAAGGIHRTWRSGKIQARSSNSAKRSHKRQHVVIRPRFVFATVLFVFSPLFRLPFTRQALLLAAFFRSSFLLIAPIDHSSRRGALFVGSERSSRARSICI